MKTFKRDYVRVNSLPDAKAVLRLLDGWFEDYNTNHPHNRLGMRSRKDFIRAMSATAACPVLYGQLHPHRNDHGIYRSRKREPNLRVIAEADALHLTDRSSREVL